MVVTKNVLHYDDLSVSNQNLDVLLLEVTCLLLLLILFTIIMKSVLKQELSSELAFNKRHLKIHETQFGYIQNKVLL